MEAIYAEAEMLIKDSLAKRNYEALDGLDKEYEKVLVWFEPDFQKMLDMISVVVV